MQLFKQEEEEEAENEETRKKKKKKKKKERNDIVMNYYLNFIPLDFNEMLFNLRYFRKYHSCTDVLLINPT